MTKWLLRQSSADISAIARQSGLPPVLARILAVRGLRDSAAVLAFLHPEQAEPASPFEFADMRMAVRIAAAAIQEERKCAIFGDYDVDGVMSTVILHHTLCTLGADVIYYIPQREQEGYGLNIDAIRSLYACGVSVLFACDNGISAFEQVEFAKALGMRVVILDHHAVTVKDGQQLLPAADAVVDAQRNDCAYPFSQYCAAGVCYRFSEALFLECGKDWQETGAYLLPFAALATVCDLVELYGENRALLKRGLPAISNSSNPGLHALLEVTGLADKEIDTYHVGFILGPCINASGRLDIADKAVELFLTEDAIVAKQLATTLSALNQERRRLTDEGARLANEQIEAHALARDPVIVLHCPALAESIAGIVAGRIRERYHHPVVVLAGAGDTVRGSCRSIEAYNIYQGLAACSDLLLAFGGHPMAAGLTISAANIPLLRQRINADCGLQEEDLQQVFRIDCPLQPAAADLELAKALQCLAPYGKGHPQPLFAAKGLRLTALQQLGRDGRVLRWQMQEENGRSFEAIDFSGRDRLQDEICRRYGEQAWLTLLRGRSENAVRLDIIYLLQVNRYHGRESAQLQIVDFRLID